MSVSGVKESFCIWLNERSQKKGFFVWLNERFSGEQRKAKEKENENKELCEL